MSEQIRLNKFLGTNLGVSRREADNLISAGKVLVNGKPAILGARIFDDDEVVVLLVVVLDSVSLEVVLLVI